MYIDGLTLLYPKVFSDVHRRACTVVFYVIQWCTSKGLHYCILRYSVVYIEGLTLFYYKVFSDVHRRA